jgi:long-chain acyl-CoA synthetase
MTHQIGQKELPDVGFWKVAPKRGNSLGILDPTGEQLTFNELYGRVNQISHFFRHVGLKMGDTIAVIGRNRVDTMSIHLAAMQSGLYYTPINYHSVSSEIEYILRDSETALVLFHPDFADSVLEACKSAGIEESKRVTLGVLAGHDSLHDVISGFSKELPTERFGGSVLQYTSGTTGRPKGVRRKIAGIDADEAAASLRWVLEMYGIDASKPGTMLTTTPIYHSSGLNISTLAIHFGVSIILMDKWTPELMLELIEKHKVNMTIVVPTQFVRLLKLDEEIRNRYDISSMEWVIHGAAPCSPEVKKQMIQWWGPTIFEYYGSTEVGGTFVNAQDWLLKPGTVGKPGPVTKLHILDDDGNELPTGTVGKVYMRQGNDQAEYLNDPEKTIASRCGDLMTVGDLGWVDEDGYLFLAGRSSEVIIVGGANVYPAEIENVILGHPEVADVCVVGIPNEEYGEEIFSAVVLRNESLQQNNEDSLKVIEEIQAMCVEHLAKFKRPRRIELRNEIPRDPNGKMYRKKVRDPFWANLERSI